MSPEPDLHEYPQVGRSAEETDSRPAELGFGDGGVPWLLLLFYLSFLVFFTWYALEYQLPEYLEHGGPVVPPVTATPEGQ